MDSHVWRIADGGTDAESETTSCAGSSCSFDWTLDTRSFPGGKWIIRVEVADGAGSTTTMSFWVRLPGWGDAVPAPSPPLPESERLEQARTFRGAFNFRADDAYLRDLEGDPAAMDAIPRWGTPLKNAEEDELSLRLDVGENAPAIDDYVASSPSARAAYAGRYIDQDSGGLVYVGFTSNADDHLAEIAETFKYPDRLRSFPVERTEAELESLNAQIVEDLDELVAEGIDVRTVMINIPSNVVDVDVESPTPAQRDVLAARYGAGARLVQAPEVHAAAQLLSRFAIHSRIMAGLQIFSGQARCAAGFSARSERSMRPRRYYTITAGHCGRSPMVGDAWHQGDARSDNPSEWHGRRIGIEVANAFHDGSTADAMLIRSRRRRISNRIFWPVFRLAVTEVETAETEGESGDIYCFSGPMTGNGGYYGHCGVLIATRVAVQLDEFPNVVLVNQRELVHVFTQRGDSGAPIYRRLSGRRRARAAGVLSAFVPGFASFYYSHIANAARELGVVVCSTRRCP